MSETSERFLCTSYVNNYPKGPLSITAIENGTLRLVSVLFDTLKVRKQLSSGTPLDEVVSSLKTIQHTDQSYPVEELERVVWNDFGTDVVFTFEHETRRKRVTTYIADEDDRERLLSTIRDCVSCPVRCFDESASVLAVAWTRILGAVMALAGTIVFYLMWDPDRLKRIDGGHLALRLGREGCVVVGAGIFVACCVSAWLAIRKRSRYYTLLLNNKSRVT